MNRIRHCRRGVAGFVALLAIGCGLPRRQDVDLAQSVNEMGVVVQDLQGGQADLQARIDSLATVVARQDSTIRSLANLLGSPIPR